MKSASVYEIVCSLYVLQRFWLSEERVLMEHALGYGKKKLDNKS